MNKDLRNALELLVKEVSKGELVLVEVNNTEVQDEVAQKRNAKANKVEQEVETEEVNGTSEYSMEELKAMTQVELKALAKELGVPVRGSKSAILGRIVEKLDITEEEMEEVETDVADEVAEEVAEVEIDPVQEALEGLELEELADLCEQAELSTKGKKQALIARLMTAHNAGDIDITDFFEEEYITEEIEEAMEEEEGIAVEEILEEQDLKTVKAIAKALGIKPALKDKKPALIEKINGCDPKKVVDTLIELGIIEPTDDVEDEDSAEEVSEGIEMPKFEGSKKRVKKCEETWTEIMTDLEEGEIEEGDIREFFEDRYKGNKSELKKIAKKDWEDLAVEYAEIMANLYDDDGDDVELEEPYMVDETPYCCGVPMKKLNDNTYVCEIDGEEVEIEE